MGLDKAFAGQSFPLPTCKMEKTHVTVAAEASLSVLGGDWSFATSNQWFCLEDENQAEMSWLWYLASHAVPEYRQPYVPSLLWTCRTTCWHWCVALDAGRVHEERRWESFLWATQWGCSWADSCLAAGLQVLHLSLAVYVRLRLRLGDEQHP